MAPIFWISLALLLFAAGLAAWRGGGWERLTAAVLVLLWVASWLAPFDGVGPPWAVIALDGVVCVYLLYAAVFSGRHWTVWAAAMQLLVMANHLAFVRFTEIERWAYLSGYYLWSDGVMVALVAGILTRRGKTRAGHD